MRLFKTNFSYWIFYIRGSFVLQYGFLVYLCPSFTTKQTSLISNPVQTYRPIGFDNKVIPFTGVYYKRCGYKKNDKLMVLLFLIILLLTGNGFYWISIYTNNDNVMIVHRNFNWTVQETVTYNSESITLSLKQKYVSVSSSRSMFLNEHNC